ncbi:SRPBCC domain-containing protein [Microbispora sp. KK1-11]|uniref:SRPBCC family protein n=1 Tax=Microbispora sp. KK1-11 TaxID=2053005 RepID=UPI00115BCE7F|nr:SRPBCC domain-containing protein [Microbispora sp. KK1-11]TQS30208.1 SRPBCC domain-containing protein [Microbispora sp. KK1-11]
MIAESATHPAVRRERTLAAPPHTVYRAWLDPDVLRLWLAPGDLEGVRAEVDERVGGRYRIWQTSSDQPIGGFDAQLLELVPDRRIVWRWGFTGPGREAGPMFDSLLTVELSETADGGTHMTLLHERLDALAAAMPHVADQIGGGWDGVLDRLTLVVKR